MGLTQEEANEREQYWIEYYDTWVGGDSHAKGYNLSKGGGHKENYGHIENPVKIFISIPEDVKAKLEAEAQKQDRSMAWITREILQNYFKDKEGK